MEYSFDIFDKNPERLATILAENCRKRRLDNSSVLKPKERYLLGHS